MSYKQLLEQVLNYKPEEVLVEHIIPFEQSELHSLSFEELKSKLNEARVVQHLIKKGSVQEAKHWEFVSEATKILEYKQLNEQTAEELHTAIKSGSASTARTAVMNKKATAEHVGAALQHPHPEVRLAAIKHPKATAEHITAAMKDKDPYVRAAAAAHKNATAEHLNMASHDKDRDVQAAGRDNKVARKRLGEEVVAEEQIDELSAKTLGSYAKKAMIATTNHAYKAGGSGLNTSVYHDNKNKAKKRMVGLNRAIGRMSEELLVKGDLVEMFTNEGQEQVSMGLAQVFVATESIAWIENLESGEMLEIKQQSLQPVLAEGVTIEKVELDELSAPVLNRYVMKAKHNVQNNTRAAVEKLNSGDKKSAFDMQKQSIARKASIAKATGKMKSMSESELLEMDEAELKDVCWKGYEAYGKKEKDGKQVPNCVPVKKD